MDGCVDRQGRTSSISLLKWQVEPERAMFARSIMFSNNIYQPQHSRLMG
jgi:hypothetical protein